MSVELEIKLYNDLLLIEAFQSNKEPSLFVKNAFSFSQFFTDVKNYFSNQINPNDKLGSVVNLIAPGIIFRALGMGKIGTLLSIVASAMGIDFAGMIRSTWQKLHPLFSNEKISEADIDAAVNDAVMSQDTTLTEDQKNKAADALKKMSSLTIANVLELRAIADSTYNRIIKKESVNDIKSYYLNLSKTAAGKGIKSNLIIFAGKIIKFIFTALVAALGINLTTNVAKKVFNKPNAFDGPIHTNNKEQIPSEQTEQIVNKSNQTTFQLDSGYQNKQYNGVNSSWIEKYPNTTSGITKMLLDFAKDVYNGLDGLDSRISNVGDFVNTLNKIEQYNVLSAGDNVVFLPKQFKTKKQIVDTFIDDVANNLPKERSKQLEPYQPKTTIIM